MKLPVPPPMPMEEVTLEDYLQFASQRRFVDVGGRRVPIYGALAIHTCGPPDSYEPESHSLWSFPERGRWATHDGSYPGNWSPFVPRNLVLRYTNPGDLVLDPMMGSGTTLVECRLLGRNALGVDVNRESVMIARDRLAFEFKTPATPVYFRTFLGDARFLDKISDESVDLIATHPPYGSIIRYGSTPLPGDLSTLPSFESYLEGMFHVAMECFRVTRRGGHCAILIGDTRRHGHVVLISVGVLRLFLAAGFVVREDLVKVQHNVSSERGQWGGTFRGFYKLAHERLFVLRKPEGPQEAEHLELSSDRMVRLVDSVASHASSMSAR